MMDLNTKLVLGFLIWSAVSLILIIGERIRSRYWKRAAHVMDCHADDLQERFDILNELHCDSEPKAIFGGPNTGIAMTEQSYTLVEEGKQVGKWWFDEEEKRFKFEGDLELSAQIFAAHILEEMNRENT